MTSSFPPLPTKRPGIRMAAGDNDDGKLDSNYVRTSKLETNGAMGAYGLNKQRAKFRLTPDVPEIVH